MLSGVVDREAESEALRALAESGDRKLALLYGRRRVGKTFLLTHLWEPNRAFYFTASATTPEINRQVLVTEAAQWSGEDLRPEDYPTWRAVFRVLLELAPQRDVVLVLDEFQYLAHDDRGLLEIASELNAVWEGRPSRAGGLLLVLSGSSIRTLEALKRGGSPLFGRLDWHDQLRPFDYFDAGRMVDQYGPLDRIRTYGAFGGLPKYLHAVDTTQSLGQNIVGLLLSPSGSVRLQLETTLAQEEGLREYTKYQGILGAIGTKRRRLGDVAAALGRKLDTPFRRMVSQLVEMGYLEADRNFGEAGNQALRYRIADPALRMYYGLILPNESAIASAGPDVVWQDRLAQQVFPAYVGLHVFEDVVQQAFIRHRESKDLPPVEVWGRWMGRDRERKDAELDVVARLLDGRILTGSAKMRSRAADATMVMSHIADLTRLAESGRSWAQQALDPASPILFVSTGGFTDSFHSAAKDLGNPVIAWTIEDLH